MLVRPTHEYVSNVWNSKMSTGASNLEHIQWKFVALFKNLSFLMTMSLMRKLRKFTKCLKLHTLHDRRLCLDALFFILAHSGLKCFLFLLVVTVIQVLPHNIRNSCIFTVTCKSLCLLGVDWLLTLCAEMAIYLESALLHSNRLCANLCRYVNKLSMLLMV